MSLFYPTISIDPRTNIPGQRWRPIQLISITSKACGLVVDQTRNLVQYKVRGLCSWVEGQKLRHSISKVDFGVRELWDYLTILVLDYLTILLIRNRDYFTTSIANHSLILGNSHMPVKVCVSPVISMDAMESMAASPIPWGNTISLFFHASIWVELQLRINLEILNKREAN